MQNQEGKNVANVKGFFKYNHENTQEKQIDPLLLLDALATSPKKIKIKRAQQATGFQRVTCAAIG